MVVLTLKAKHDHLEKVAATRDCVKALAEFVWNALDADAKKVNVDLMRNALGGLESILIRDDGTGISKVRAAHDFESLGESWKLKRRHTPLLSRAIHGKEGKGRLRFFSLAQKATWSTVYKEATTPYRLKIEIKAATLQTSEVSDPEPAQADTPTGTVVELAPLKDTFDWLGSDEAYSDFGAIFAPYILQYPGAEITYDGKGVDPFLTIERTREFGTCRIVVPALSRRPSLVNLDLSPLCRELGFERVCAVAPWERVVIGDIAYTALPYHGEGSGPEGAQDWTTYAIEAGSKLIIGMFDSCRDDFGTMDDVLIEARRRMGDADLLLSPCSDFRFGVRHFHRRPFALSGATEQFTGSAADTVRWAEISGAAMIVPYAEFFFDPADAEHAGPGPGQHGSWRDLGRIMPDGMAHRLRPLRPRESLALA